MTTRSRNWYNSMAETKRKIDNAIERHNDVWVTISEDTKTGKTIAIEEGSPMPEIVTGKTLTEKINNPPKEVEIDGGNKIIRVWW